MLQRLSDGPGVPVVGLEQMTLPRVWARRLDELRQFAAPPEGQAEWERLTGRRVSHHS